MEIFRVPLIKAIVLQVDSDGSRETRASVNNQESQGGVTVVAEKHPAPIKVLGEEPLATKTFDPEVHPEIVSR